MADLIPYPGNARTHSPAQIRQIRDSIKAFGFVNPILINAASIIVAGHGRVQAAKLLGMLNVPTISLESLNPDQIRAYALADNKLALEAGWDLGILKTELQHLLTLDTTFDISVTGFSIPEVDMVLEQGASATDQDDEIVQPLPGPPVTQFGDLWQLGPHRILCGSALEEESFSRLLCSRKADMVFLDPPYNVPISGHASGNGAIKHTNFQMACGEMTGEEFMTFLRNSLGLLTKYSRSGSVHFIAMDWRGMEHLLKTGNEVYSSMLNLCVWTKNNGGMGSLWRSQHELIFVFKNGTENHRNNVQLGRFGRNRTNVWAYPGANTFSKQSEEGNLLALHPTVKPVALIADAMLDCSARGDLILDSFLGSGSTIIAAERVGRVCCGIELEPRYIDIAIRRWQERTGDAAVLEEIGKTFQERTAEVAS